MRAHCAVGARAGTSAPTGGPCGRVFAVGGVRGGHAELSQPLRAAARAAVPHLHERGELRSVACRWRHGRRGLAEERLHVAVLHPRLFGGVHHLRRHGDSVRAGFPQCAAGDHADRRAVHHCDGAALSRRLPDRVPRSDRAAPGPRRRQRAGRWISAGAGVRSRMDAVHRASACRGAVCRGIRGDCPGRGSAARRLFGRAGRAVPARGLLPAGSDGPCASASIWGRSKR